MHSTRVNTTSIFIFRRGLRLHDNTGLNIALKNSKTVIPVFIFTPTQLEPHAYRSINGLQFLLTSLRELDAALRRYGSRLHIFFGEIEQIMPLLINHAQAVYVNQDYTPYSRKRDQKIQAMCESGGVYFESTEDYLLVSPDVPKTSNNTPFRVFTAFAKWYQKNAIIPIPERLFGHNFGTLPLEKMTTIDHIASMYIPKQNKDIMVHGGRTEGLRLLRSLQNLQNYPLSRNALALRGTSSLSAHHKFGTISIRETHHTALKFLNKDTAEQYINELLWRDFMTYIAWHYPNIFTDVAWNPRFAGVRWDENPEALHCWKNGLTGYPIVDAGVRQLLQTGWMHNRVRMITASFLTKHLHIHWRYGEQFFAQHLVDYDPCVNNGNWQWVASTGASAQPYFRVFNPWLQQLKFDPECKYIKTYIPELRDISIIDIHQWHKHTTQPTQTSYPLPIVDHKTAVMETKKRFSEAFASYS